MAVDMAFNIARRFAPGLVRKIAGDKAGNVAQRIMDIGAEITGASDPEEIQRRLEQDAAKQAEFQMQAAQFEHDLDMAFLADRSDARSRDVSMTRAGKDNIRADVLAYGVMIGWLTLLALVVFFTPADDWAKGVLAGGFGALSMRLADVFQFEFGSSRGSKEKEALLGANRSGSSASN